MARVLRVVEVLGLLVEFAPAVHKCKLIPFATRRLVGHLVNFGENLFYFLQVVHEHHLARGEVLDEVCCILQQIFSQAGLSQTFIFIKCLLQTLVRHSWVLISLQILGVLNHCLSVYNYYLKRAVKIKFFTFKGHHTILVRFQVKNLQGRVSKEILEISHVVGFGLFRQDLKTQLSWSVAISAVVGSR